MTPHHDNHEPNTSRTIRLRYFVAFGVASVIMIALAGFNLVNVPAIPTETISDKKFVNRASGSCSRVLPVIRARRPGRKDVVSVAATIRGCRRDNADLKRLVAQLRTIETQPEDAAKIDRWLNRWDDFTAVGDRYVRVLETTSDPTKWQSVANEGNDDYLRISAFARANAMTTCSLDQAFPRAAEDK